MQGTVPVVRKEDNQKGIIAAIVVFLLTLFLLFFIKYSEPDPPKVTPSIPITFEEGIDDFEIHNAGGGAPSAVTDPRPVTQEAAPEQPTQQEESPVRVPPSTSQSSGQTSGQETATPSPFGGSGSGGSGTSGSGGGFGADTGPGSETGPPGTGGSGERIRLNDITSKPKTPNNQSHTIALKVIVDANGTVIAVNEIREGTTTTNQTLIDEVKALVKKEVKYKPKPGAPNETAYYTVKVSPG
jgi:hypothetical protein